MPLRGKVKPGNLVRMAKKPGLSGPGRGLRFEPQERVAEALRGGAFQFLADRRMRHGDQRPGPLGEVAAPQVRHAVFGDDVLDHVARRDDARAGRQQRLDLRFALGCGRRDGDKGLAPFGQRSAVHEVVLAAHARDDAFADRIGAHLPREVHLDGRVDGHDARVLPDAEWVVGPRHVLHHQILAVVHVVVQPARPEGQRGHRHAGHHRLL